MKITNLHTHTSFSDGENTPKEMIEAALDAGLTAIGFSDHSYTPFDESYCMKAEHYEEYKAEISKLKEEYRDKIKVFCGIEQDYYAPQIADGFDYIIGSLHYLKSGDEYIAVDEDAETLIKAADKYFDGDFYKLCEKYFETVSDIVSKTNADIIGHFDLISKYNDKYKLFDVNNERYISAWKKAADKLLKTGKVFEINTGVLTRTYKLEPYPPKVMRDYIRQNGGKFVISGDSHNVKSIYSAKEFYLKYLNESEVAGRGRRSRCPD